MATKVGRLAQIGISTDGGSSYNDIARLVDGTVEMNVDEIEMSSHDSAGWKEFEFGLSTAQITANFIYDENETEQEQLFTSFLTKVIRNYRFVTQSGSGNSQMTATGVITQLSHSAGLNDMQMLDVTIRLNAVTRADQP